MYDTSGDCHRVLKKVGKSPEFSRTNQNPN